MRNAGGLWAVRGLVSGKDKGATQTAWQKETRQTQASAVGVIDRVADIADAASGCESAILTRYIEDPLLVDGKKADLR
jgi:hypothetical protein